MVTDYKTYNVSKAKFFSKLLLCFILGDDGKSFNTYQWLFA